jgi:glycosyltransferase involved in cell wall biosynthesis
MPVISITTPTFRRHKLLERQHATVLAQSEQDFEWLILDDSPEPSAYFAALADRRIRYHHHAGTRMSVGAKRNWLAERAEAPVIAHFDDDDYYAPDYLKTMLAHLSRRGADMAKFSAWYVWSRRHQQLAFWDTTITGGLVFKLSAEPVEPLIISKQDEPRFASHYAGFGFNYVYRKAVWQDIRFPDADFAEDYGFAGAAIQAGCRYAHFPDTEGLCLQIMQPEGISIAWPQWLLPGFLLPKLFPPAALELLAR